MAFTLKAVESAEHDVQDDAQGEHIAFRAIQHREPGLFHTTRMNLVRREVHRDTIRVVLPVFRQLVFRRELAVALDSVRGAQLDERERFWLQGPSKKRGVLLPDRSVVRNL